MNQSVADGPADAPEHEQKKRRTGWDAPVLASPEDAQQASSFSGLADSMPSVGLSGPGMIGDDLKSIIAAKIAAGRNGTSTVVPTSALSSPDPAMAMACRIYIGSLYYDLTGADVTALFEGFGDIVKCEMQMDNITGRSKGFCFLEFKTPEQAQAAMAMNGFEIAGRKIKVGRPYGGANGAAAPVGVISIVASVTAATSVALSGVSSDSSVNATNSASTTSSVPVLPVPDTATASSAVQGPVELFSIVLENMVSAQEARTNNDLAREVMTEAARYGPLTGEVQFEYVTGNASTYISDGATASGEQGMSSVEETQVRVVLTYVLAKDAKRSLRAMNGRLFDGRVITATLR